MFFISDCDTGSDVVFIVDSSASISQEKFYVLLNYLKYMSQTINLNTTRLAAVTFSDTSKIEFTFNARQTKQSLSNLLNFHYVRGTTNTAAGIRSMREIISAENANNNQLAVLFTDGASSNWRTALREAADAHGRFIQILTVGIEVPAGNHITELRAMTSDPDNQNLILVDKFENLENYTNRIIDGICNGKLKLRLNELSL